MKRKGQRAYLKKKKKKHNTKNNGCKCPKLQERKGHPSSRSSKNSNQDEIKEVRIETQTQTVKSQRQRKNLENIMGKVTYQVQRSSHNISISLSTNLTGQMGMG